MLGAGDDAVRLAEAAALEAADLSGGHGGAQERILPGALDNPAPPGISGDVDHWREGPMDADRARLPSRHRLTLLDDPHIPGGGHGDRDREDGPQPVNDVEAEQQRDAETVAVKREPLQPVDLRGISHEQQRSCLASLQRPLH